MKDFTKMKEYIVEQFYTEQHNIFILSFGKNFNIVYHPEIKGYVLSGESFPQLFTEYWEIRLDFKGKWYLLGITQV